MKASYQKYILNFKKPAGTSRGTYNTKETYFLKIEENGKVGFGECSLFKGLSADDRPEFEAHLSAVVKNLNLSGLNAGWKSTLSNWPSILFGLETALISLQKNSHILFPSEFTDGKSGITTNGLIWMGDVDFMRQQIEEKLKVGFKCIKLKIGAINWEDEFQILKSLRKNFSANALEIRVDANGGFTPTAAPKILEQLNQLNIHSIEQPIMAGQYKEMAMLCRNTPIPIALDEELIGLFEKPERAEMLDLINAQYIILKPGIIGGLASSEEWIKMAEARKIGWWVTSSLESNIGLNAIAQWTYALNTSMPQGLGTGSLFTNNIESPLEMRGEELFYNKDKNWQNLPDDWK